MNANKIIDDSKGDGKMDQIIMLGDFLGSLMYTGRCADCRSQFMSRRERVVIHNNKAVCLNCVHKRRLVEKANAARGVQ